MESRILKFETNTGRLWIAGTYGINKKPFNKKIIQDIVVKSEIKEFIVLANNMSYSLKVAATLLRGLMLIYDKQWLYLESDLDNLYSRFREGKAGETKSTGISIIKRVNKNDGNFSKIPSIDSSLSMSGNVNMNNETSSEIGMEKMKELDMVFSFDTEHFILDLSNKNIGRIDEITLPRVGEGMIMGEFVENKNMEKGMDDVEMMHWSSINNEEFMFGNESNAEIMDNIEKIMSDNKNGCTVTQIDHKDSDNDRTSIHVVREEGLKKRVRSLSYLDVDLRHKINRFQLQENELLLNSIMISSIDEKNRGWDTHKWWQLKFEKSEKELFENKFLRITGKSINGYKKTLKNIGLDIANINIQSSLNSRNGIIEKHRGEVLNNHKDNKNIENNIGIHDDDLRCDGYNVNELFTLEEEYHTSNARLGKYRQSLNSSEGAKIYTGERDSLVFSNSNRNRDSTEIRLSAMLDSRSVISCESSPFGFDKNIINRNSLLNNNNRTSSIGSSDCFPIDETGSNMWSKSGITTSSGTYNLKTYTVQKFIMSRMKEIRDIKRINKENIHSNKCIKNKSVSGVEVDKNCGGEVDELSIYLNELLPEKYTSKYTAATFFYHLLVLATYNEIKLEQKVPGENIKITKISSTFGNEES